MRWGPSPPALEFLHMVPSALQQPQPPALERDSRHVGKTLVVCVVCMWVYVYLCVWGSAT